MRFARMVAMVGALEIGAVIWYGVGVYLGWFGPMVWQVSAVFGAGVLMVVGGSAYTAGWHARVEHERARQWASVASLPAGAGPVDAILDHEIWNRPDLLLAARVERGTECAFGGWLNPPPGRARCLVPRCLHVSTDPRGPGWSRAGHGQWLCPCESRHELLRSQPSAAM